MNFDRELKKIGEDVRKSGFRYPESERKHLASCDKPDKLQLLGENTSFFHAHVFIRDERQWHNFGLISRLINDQYGIENAVTACGLLRNKPGYVCVLAEDIDLEEAIKNDPGNEPIKPQKPYLLHSGPTE